MIYFVNWDGDMSRWPDWYGILRSPRKPSVGVLERSRRQWCGDNDAFHGLYSPKKFAKFMDTFAPFKGSCRFIVCPDVVGDSVATSEMWDEHSIEILRRGYPAAFVMQDGHEYRDVPAGAHAIFIGGSTEFKYSSEVAISIATARRAGLWVHVGRVNSQRRLAYFNAMGVDSADGTTINRAPEFKRRQLDSQLNQRRLPLINSLR